MKYRKKPVEEKVEAVQITVDMVLDKLLPDGVRIQFLSGNPSRREVHTFRGSVRDTGAVVRIGDWLLETSWGGTLVRSNDEFQATYEKVEELRE